MNPKLSDSPIRSVGQAMTKDAQSERISRRLKAARWLAGTGRNGKLQPIALPATELAAHPLLKANGITASRIEEIEQERITPRPMELEKIAVALGVGEDWFKEDADAAPAHLTPEQLRAAAEILGPQVLAAAQALRQAREQAPPDTDGQDLPGSAQGGGDG